MPLIELLEKTPEILRLYTIKQIVSAAGNGVLSDGSECSKELRHFLRNIRVDELSKHLKHCLSSAFENSGFVLQDIVNEFGRRLDYEVEDGLYRGRQNKIGNDGLWIGQDGHAILVEIKTTDTYRINLDTISTYRERLIENARITSQSSILIVVGRDDTGDLEAQIRGSRQAWHTRIISAEALLKLVELKIKSDDDQTTEKIRSLLIPFEYTRLDNIIDVVFSAAKDVENTTEETIEPLIVDTSASRKQQHSPQSTLEAVRNSAVAALAKRDGINLIAHKRIQYWTDDKKLRVVCPVSKRYEGGYYWYGLHPHQIAFLEEAAKGILLLGCVDSTVAYAIPIETIREILPLLNTTEMEDRTYWHIHIQTNEHQGHELLMSKGERMSVDQFAIGISG